MLQNGYKSTQSVHNVILRLFREESAASPKHARSTFLASLPQWAGQRLGYGQVRLPKGEKGHQFESNPQTRYSQENTRLNLQVGEHCSP